MDKSIIKNRLTERFLSEDSTPGIKVTDKIKKESGKINKAALKSAEKEFINYDKNLKQEDKENKTMGQNKFNGTDDEKTYHDEMEILNGQEMIQYEGETTEDFKKRAKEGMGVDGGSSRMGNKIEANAEETFNGSSDKFGDNLEKRVKSSTKKRADNAIQTAGIGDVQIPTNKKVKPANVAVNENNNKPKIKESMKRLKFKKVFNGVGNALKLIPEAYRTDNKEFEMTDGNETYRIRWEGTLTEGRAVILTASDKKMVNEDMAKMKHLMGYKSQETLGLVKGNARIDENKSFSDIWNKSKMLLEGSDIEGTKGKEGSAESLDDATKHAPEAKKHVEGSVKTDKKGEAPKPKEDEWEDVEKNAPEATKHVEGSVKTDKKTEAPKPKEGEWEKIKEEVMMDIEAPTPKEGDWDEIEMAPTPTTDKGTEAPETKESSMESIDDATNVAPEATKHVEGSESTDDGTQAPAPKEGNWDEINVPQASDAKKHVKLTESAPTGTSTILFSPSTGEYWLKVGDSTTKVVKEHLNIASDKSMRAYERAEKIVELMDTNTGSGVNVEAEENLGINETKK